MRDFEAAAVRDVIESLIAEIGIDQVPAEIDVDAALTILNEEIYGSEEERAELALADLEEEALVAESEGSTPNMERVPE